MPQERIEEITNILKSMDSLKDWYPQTNWTDIERNLTNELTKLKFPPTIEVEVVDNNERRVLVIPDLHFPFQHKNAITFLKGLYDKYDCNEVVCLGDILDNHFHSFHDSDPDGLSANEEFDKAVEGIKELATLFPKVKVCAGNHDKIPMRKAFKMGISKKWVVTIKDVLLDAGCPIEDWDFAEHFIIDDVKYVHGVARMAKKRMIDDGRSCVSGHRHTQTYLDYHYNDFHTLFAMQLGALIDKEAYAFAYANDYVCPYLSAGVVLNDGTQPIIEFMNQKEQN